MSLEDIITKFRFWFDVRGIKTTQLPQAPTGWRQMLIEYARDPKYMGLSRQVTGQLDFVRSAAKILRREYAAYRTLAQVNLRIDIDAAQPMNTYENIYSGKIDFSKKIDKQSIFTVNAKSLDFSQNISAYDGQQYSIPLTGGINLQLPSLNLNEQATIVIQPNSDERSNAFFILSIGDNQQNSIDPSIYTYGGQFAQVTTPVWATDGHYFYYARTNTNVLFNVTIQGRVLPSNTDGDTTYSIKLVKSDGTLIRTLYSTIANTPPNNFSVNENFTVPMLTGERLFLYFATTDGDSNHGFRIDYGQMTMSYQTSSPPSMCQALTGSQLFAALLQAMNTNTDNAPNEPVYYQSFLLAQQLAPLVFTSSDSIRAAQGSIYIAGETIGTGRYKVIQGSVTYDSLIYTTGMQFTFDLGATSFSGGGVVQKILGGFVGQVYNIGDSLQAGGTYEVGGLNDGFVTYNAVNYTINQTFKYVLGKDTFTGSDDTMFVKQIGVDPQIIISFSDFFQTVKSVQGGDAAFGVNRYTALNSTPLEQAKQLSGVPFIETLANVFKAGTGRINLGVLSKAWQSEAALDMMYNTISVGQKDQQYDAFNGAQEVSSTQYYSSSLLTPVLDLNLVSAVRFDPYGAESVRITQNDTAASRSDNDTWGFWINTTPVDAGGYVYYNPLGQEGLMTNPITGKPMISGVDPSYYNYKLSPKTNLHRGDRYLASIFYGMNGQQLRLTGYEKNVAMVYTGIDGVRIAESEPVDLGNLGAAYFQCEYVSDTLSCPDLGNNQYADVSFTVNGNLWRAFAVSYKANPALGKPQAVKLLLTADALNDMSRTVR